MMTIALLMGFAGSLHCVGMCSPLAMAVINLTPALMLNRLVYNAGRLITYGVLGFIAGSAGSALQISTYQNIISVALGLGLLAFACLGVSSVRLPLITSLLAKVTTRIKILFSTFFERRNYASIFTLGALNGILPCGLTFIAIAYSVTLGSPLKSMYHMLLFGAGTLPVMFGLTTFIQYLVKRFDLNFKKVTTTMLFISGCMLIARVFVFGHAQPSPEEQHVVDIILCR